MLVSVQYDLDSVRCEPAVSRKNVGWACGLTFSVVPGDLVGPNHHLNGIIKGREIYKFLKSGILLQ